MRYKTKLKAKTELNKQRKKYISKCKKENDEIVSDYSYVYKDTDGWFKIKILILTEKMINKSNKINKNSKFYNILNNDI